MTIKAQTPQRSLRSHKSAVPSSKTGEKNVMAKIGNREKSVSRKKQRIQSPSPANEISASLSEMDEDDPLFDPNCDMDTNMKVEKGERHLLR